MDKYYAIESQKSDFCRVSDVLLKQPIGVTLTVEQRNNLTAHIISSNTHYIGKLWSNAAILSSIIYTTNETISRLLPYPLDILLTQVATADTSGNAYTYLLENPLFKNQTQQFPKADYEKLRRSIQLLETVSIVSLKTAKERFSDLLDIFHWYIMEHNMGSFYVDQTHNRIAIDITFMKTGKVREFLQLFQWCEEARRFLMRYFHEHKLNATLYRNSFKAELRIGDTVLNNKMQGIAENISKLASDAQLANDNNQNNRVSTTDTNNEIVDANNNNVNNSIETASHEKNGADSVIDSDKNIITQDDPSVHTDEELQANDNNQNSNDNSTLANNQNVLLLGMATADLVSIGYKEDRSQSPPELVECVLRQVNGSTGGKKMETNLGRDTLRVTMVMNHPSVGSVHTVSLANKSDVKYNENHISSNFTDSRRFVQRLKKEGFGADGIKIDCLIMDYYWFQSVRMQ